MEQHIRSSDGPMKSSSLPPAFGSGRRVEILMDGIYRTVAVVLLSCRGVCVCVCEVGELAGTIESSPSVGLSG